MCAYYVENGHVNKSVLKTVLYSKLPEYMVPQYFIKMEEMPHTPNGKIDRKALPEPIIEKDKKQIVAPRNETEEFLVKIIEQKLGMKEIGIDTNIFDIGADSLSVIGIVTELFRHNYNIKVRDVYKYPTVRELYDKILKSTSDISEQIEHPELSKINEKVETLSMETKCIKVKDKYTILLTGATGFFGAHLLVNILENKECIEKIYCIVRSKKNVTAEERLRNKLHFYFSTEYDKVFNKYVEVIEGEITKEQFNLNAEQYNKIIDKTNIVIHSAANVKHYENYKNSEESNVIATKNIIDFCKKANARLHYISTMTISGNYLSKQDRDINKIFDENSFFIGQNFEDNVYSKSKLIAEALVINYMDRENKATIYRLGDLTGRYSDGGFQENISSNGTYLRLRSILEIGAIPEEIENMDLEFSPVDCVAEAVRLIIWSNKCDNRIFNIYNPNLLSVLELQKIIKKQNYEIKVMSKENFSKLIKEISSSEDTQNKLTGIINDFTDNNDLIYNYTIKQSNKITCEYLKNLGFSWINIDEEYINKLILYMKKVKFIK